MKSQVPVSPAPSWSTCRNLNKHTNGFEVANKNSNKVQYHFVMRLLKLIDANMRASSPRALMHAQGLPIETFVHNEVGSSFH